MTKLYDIITNEDDSLYAVAASWCNNNNAMIEEIEPIEKEVSEDYIELNNEGEEIKITTKSKKQVRQFKIVPIPDPTVAELQSRVRSIRDNYLEKTDKYVLKDFPISEEDQNKYIVYRQYLRDFTKQENWWTIEIMTFEQWSAR